MKVLAVLPGAARGPAARLLKLLSAGGREVDAVAGFADFGLRRLGARPAPEGGAALAARVRAVCAAADYAAIVVVESDAAPGLAGELTAFQRRPVVLARLAPESRRARAEAPLRLRPAREGEPLCEVWDFSPEGGARLEEGWIKRRLEALARGRPPAARGLASIIVPCWNNLRDTRACLEAVARRTAAAHEVIVVDNGSTDGTASWARARARTRVIRHARNLGFARAINAGMRAARGEWLVWLNNDVLVTRGWLERLIAAASRAPWIGAAGPCTNETVGLQRVEGASYVLGAGLDAFAEAWSLKNEGRARAAHRLTGFCLLLRREAYRRVGELDERFGVGTYEEYDYCLRLRQAGWELAVAEDCFVHHHGSRTFRSRESMERQAALNREVFIDKWCRRSLEFLDEINPVLSRRAGRATRA